MGRPSAATVMSGLALGLATAALAVALTRDPPARPIHRLVVANTSAQDPTVDKWVDAQCPKGYAAVGGGGYVPHGNDTPGVALYWSSPLFNGWNVAAQDSARRMRPWLMNTVAVCLAGVVDDRSDAEALPAETVGGD
jgi:hypothetical protein